MRITHNAHVFIIRPFVQLFWCSLVLFLLLLLLFSACFLCFVFLWVCFFRFFSFSVSFSLLRVCIVRLLFFWSKLCWSCLFTVADFLLIPKCGCIFRFFLLLFFSLSLSAAFFILFFRWSAFNSSLFSQICSSFSFCFSTRFFVSITFISFHNNYLYAADVNWPFRYFSRSGFFYFYFIFKYTRTMCAHNAIDSTGCITCSYSEYTYINVNANKFSTNKMWYFDCNYECNRCKEEMSRRRRSW